MTRKKAVAASTTAALVCYALFAFGGEVEALEPVSVPIVLPPIQCPSSTPSDHESDLFPAWAARAGLPAGLNVPTFDLRNRPYMRDRGDHRHGIPGTQSMLRQDAWQSRDFFADILNHFGATEVTEARWAGGWEPAQIVFDRDDHAYTALRVNLDGGAEKSLLLYSTDHAGTWQVFELPGNDQLYIETPHSPEPLDGVPAILLWRDPEPENEEKVEKVECETSSEDWMGRYGDLGLLVPTKQPGGTLSLGAEVAVASDVMGVDAHTGGGTQVLRKNGKVHLVWAEVDPMCGTQGSPTYAASYDIGTGSLTTPVFLAHAKPTNDAHNTPALTMDRAGYVHVVTGAHGDDFLYLKSHNPHDTATWTVPVATAGAWPQADCWGRPGTGCQTYVALMRNQWDDLHLVYRQRRYGESHFNGHSFRALVHQRKRPSGNWEQPTVLQVPPSACYSNWYHKLGMDRYGQIYLSYSYYSHKAPYGAGGGQNRYKYRSLLTADPFGNNWALMETADFVERRQFDGSVTLSGDVDGDGDTDVVSVYQDHKFVVRTGFSNPGGAWTNAVFALNDGPNLLEFMPAMTDVNGDGRADIVFVFTDSYDRICYRVRLSNGDGTWDGSHHYTSTGKWPPVWGPIGGDFNGDGRGDVLHLFVDDHGYLNVRTAQSNVDLTWSIETWNPGQVTWAPIWGPIAGELGGSGSFDDFMFMFEDSQGDLHLRTYVSDGSLTNWFVLTEMHPDGYRPDRDLVATDVDGDGLQDAVMLFRRPTSPPLGIRTKLSNGDGTYTTTTSWQPDGEGVHSFPTVGGDVDGDGRGDLVFSFSHWAPAGSYTLRTKSSLDSGASWTTATGISPE